MSDLAAAVTRWDPVSAARPGGERTDGLSDQGKDATDSFSVTFVGG